MTRNRWAVRHQTIRQQVLGVKTDTDYTPYLKGGARFPKPYVHQPVPTSLPKFRQEQIVCFQGGTGTIRSCYLESGIWAYTIEIPLGAEPDTGRVGSETTILLHEVDIQAVMT